VTPLTADVPNGKVNPGDEDSHLITNAASNDFQPLPDLYAKMSNELSPLSF
jgi:hypothetical protein